MTVPHALLAALAEGERYGYQLRSEIERELGPAWRLDFGQLYRALRGLVAKQWITFRVAPGLRGPQRKLYRLTPAGRAELTAWLAQPHKATAPTRDAVAVRRRYAATTTSKRRRGVGGGLVAVGSDDLVLDLIAQHVTERHPEATFATRAVGSISGLLALRDGHADLAGVHLLDIDTGEYNVPFIRHLLPEEPIVLIELARREQGLLVAPGNPKGIRKVADLLRPQVCMVNRQPGAGTRLLLFQQLRRARIDPHAVRGYDHELPTHAAVAAAVAQGKADAGPGVRAVADAWGLEFLPLAAERYDLAVPRRVFESPRARPLLEALHARSVRRAAAHLAGYDTSHMSAVVARLE